MAAEDEAAGGERPEESKGVRGGGGSATQELPNPCAKPQAQWGDADAVACTGRHRDGHPASESEQDRAEADVERAAEQGESKTAAAIRQANAQSSSAASEAATARAAATRLLLL